MQEPRQAENAGGSETMEPRDGRAQSGQEETRNEEIRNEEEMVAPSGLWPLWDEAEERGDRDVAALMWEAMYGRGPGR